MLAEDRRSANHGIIRFYPTLTSGDLYAKHFLAQRRKGAKKTLRNAVALCGFAALRESSSPKPPRRAKGLQSSRAPREDGACHPEIGFF